MPSDSETLGFVAIEAMASGLPVVGVAAGGLRDVIQDKETGYLVENNDNMEEFIVKTKELINSKKKRDEMGKSGAEWCQQYSWEAATKTLREVHYKAAIELFRARDEKGRHVKDIEDAWMESISTS